MFFYKQDIRVNVVSFYHSQNPPEARICLFPAGPVRALLSFFICMFFPAQVFGTPLLALRESDHCGACHNPGRTQRPLLERRCTLDCQGCHIDPNGAGPRNQWGTYYEYDGLSMLNFFTPDDPLKDSSWYDLHYDGRTMSQQSDGQFRRFPMNSDFSLRVRPFVTHLHLTAHSSFLGRIGTDQIRYHEREASRHQFKFSVMLDSLPLNTYVRVFRGTPVYSVRRPNHSLWIRERTGLGQFASTDAIAIGGTPTVPFLHYSLMQGNHQEEAEDRQKGQSFHGGMRGVTLGWHINGSYWKTSSRKASVKMQALGGGAKILEFILMGEVNRREVSKKNLSSEVLYSFESQAVRLHPSSMIGEWTLAYGGIRGIMPGIVWETLASADINSHRKSIFLDLHPFPFLQLELWRRFEDGSRRIWDTLALAHLYASF